MIAGLISLRTQAEVSTDASAVFETAVILERQDVGERREWANTVHLPKQLGNRVLLFGQGLELTFIASCCSTELE